MLKEYDTKVVYGEAIHMVSFFLQSGNSDGRIKQLQEQIENERQAKISAEQKLM